MHDARPKAHQRRDKPRGCRDSVIRATDDAALQAKIVELTVALSRIDRV